MVARSEKLSALRRLLRIGHYDAVVERSRMIAACTPEFAAGRLLAVRALAETGRMHSAAELAYTALPEIADVLEASRIRVLGAFVTAIAHPSAGNLERVRDRIQDLRLSSPGLADLAFGCKWEARLTSLEVALQIRSITYLEESCRLLKKAAVLFRQDGLIEEALDEEAALARTVAAGPPPDLQRAKTLWLEVHRESKVHGDFPMEAKALLALAEIEFEVVANGEGGDTVRAAQEIFEGASQAFIRAGMASEDAEVLASLGRKILRFGEAVGTEAMRAAAEKWEAGGQKAHADAIWRDLYVWYSQVGDAEQMDAAEEKISSAHKLEGDVGLLTDVIHAAHTAYVQGDLAGSIQTIEAGNVFAMPPLHESGLLMQRVSALLGRDAVTEARVYAERAVGLLRGATPCTMFSSTLFHLGLTCQNTAERRRLWLEARDADIACGQNIDAVGRVINLAEHLAQPQGNRAPSPEAIAESEELYRQAESMIAGGKDLVSRLVLGDLAQKRGLAAFRRQNWQDCGSFLSQAESIFRESSHNVKLAHLLTHQGLVLFHIARDSRNADTWLNAIRKFVEAAALFRRQELLTQAYRAVRLAGAAAMEGASTLSDDERWDWYKFAEARMEEALIVLERLRARTS